MIRFVLALVLLVLAFVVWGVTRKSQEPNVKAGGLAVAAVIVLVGGVLALWSIFFRVDNTEATVVRNVNGNLRAVIDPGFHLKAPWESVVRFDTKNQTIDLYGDCQSHGQGRLLDGAEDCRITSTTSDSADVFMDSTLNYSLDKTRIIDIYKTYRNQDALIERDLLPGLRSSERDAPTTYPAATIRQKRPELTASVVSDLEARLKGTGVIITRLDLRDLSLDPASTKRLRAVQLRNADIEAERQNVAKARLEAERIKTLAKAQSDADQIQRCGATSHDEQQVINGVDTTVTVIDPVSNADCENRLNEQVIASKYIDALTEIGKAGNLVVVPQGTNPILNLGK